MSARALKSSVISLIAFSLLVISGASRADDLSNLTFVTEEYPPYNFRTNGQLQGIATDLLSAAAKKTNSPVQINKIKVLPWPRAYKMAETGPKVVLFSTTRTEQREKSFQWVGPISPTRVVLLAKKSSNITINSESEIKNYTVGAILDDIGEQLVKAAGVPDKNIKRIGKAESLVKMLNTKRIQLWAYEENVARWFIKQAGLNNADFQTVYVLKESDLYYTFSKDIGSATVKKLQEGIDAVKATDEYDAIKAKYL